MPDVIKRLSHLVEPSARSKLVAAAAASFIIATLDAVGVAMVLPLVELAAGGEPSDGATASVARLLGTTDPQRLTTLLVCFLVALFVAKDVASMALSWWLTGLNFRQRLRLSQYLLTHFLTSPYTQITRRTSAELIRTMNDSVSSVFNLSLAGAVGVLTNSMAVLTIVVGVLLIAPLPTLAMTFYLGCASLLYLKSVKPRAIHAGLSMTQASERAWRHAFAALFGLRELQLRGTQHVFVDRYVEASEVGWREARIANFIGSLPRHLLEILFILAVGLITVVGAGANATTVGVLGLFVAAGFRVLPSVTALISSASQVRVGTAALELVYEEVCRAEQSRISAPSSGVGDNVSLCHELRLRGVAFRYPGADRNAIDGVDLAVPVGTTTAIVGSSGAGKTTLVDLILGLHRPCEGMITADGVDIATSLASWRSHIGYVPQDVFLLDASIAENVAFDVDRAKIDPVQLAEALEQAQLIEVVEAQPDGVDAQVGERGVLLSGGQRQRIGIARALFRRPSLLVLDEATSALDSETEHRLGKAIAALRGSLTVVVVAHRLSTVRHADQVVFLDYGKVASVGTFEEVRRTNRRFARWVELADLTSEGVTE